MLIGLKEYYQRQLNLMTRKELTNTIRELKSIIYMFEGRLNKERSKCN